jgi:tetratricopeptide (TPR) repeat protein
MALGDRLSDLVRVDKRRAFALSSAFVDLVRGDTNPVPLAIARRARAHAQRNLHRFREALRDYRVAARAFDRAGLRVESARTAIGTIDALMHLGRHAEAMRLGRRARGVFRAQGEWRRVARLDVNLANVLERMDRHRSALVRYRAAEAMFATEGAAADLALTRFNRAGALAALDRHREALPLLESSAAVWRERGMSAAYCQCRLALGSVLFRLGRLADAWAMLEEARQTAAALEDRALLATAALDQARVESMLNRANEALGRLETAIDGFTELAMHADRAEALVLRAALHARERRDTDADRDLDQAALLYRALRNRPRLTWVEYYRAVAHGLAGRRAEHRAGLERGIRAFARHGLHGAEAEARLALAEALTEDDLPGAARRLSSASRKGVGLGDPWFDYRRSLVRGRLLFQAGRFRESRGALERAHRCVQALRCALPLEVQRAFFLEDKQELFEYGLDLALGRGAASGHRRSSLPDQRAALLWSERAHAPRLRDVWNRPAGSSASSSAESASALEIARAREDLYWLDERERLGRGHIRSLLDVSTWARPNPESVTRGPARRRTQRKEAVSRLERLFHRLEMSTAQRFGLPVPREPDPRRIQAALAEDEVLLEYFVGRTAIHVLGVTRDGIEHRRLETPRTTSTRGCSACGGCGTAIVSPPSGPDTRTRSRAPRASCSRAWGVRCSIRWRRRSTGSGASPSCRIAGFVALPSMPSSIDRGRSRIAAPCATRSRDNRWPRLRLRGGRAARRWWSVRRRPSRRSPSRKPTRWP